VRQVDHRRDVEHHLGMVACRRKRLEGAVCAEAGVVDEQVDREPPHLGFGVKVARGVRAGQVGRYNLGAHPEVARQLVRQRPQPLLRARHQDNVTAARGQRARELRADAGRRAGHQSRLPSIREHLVSLPPLSPSARWLCWLPSPSGPPRCALSSAVCSGKG